MSKNNSLELLALETEYYEGLPPSCLLKPKLKEKKQPTFKVEKSSVLSSVKAFLPRLAAANEQLESTLRTVPASELDIENTDHCDGPVIEMNLALVEQADDTDSESSESGCEVDSDSDSADSDKDSPSKVMTPGCLGEVTEVNLRLPRKQQRNPGIVVLAEERLSETKSDSVVSNTGESKSDRAAVSDKAVSSDATSDIVNNGVVGGLDSD